MANPGTAWPKPTLDLRQEIVFYREEFARRKEDFADIDFYVDELVTKPVHVSALKERLLGADGVLVIQLNIEIGDILKEILAAEIGRAHV